MREFLYSSIFVFLFSLNFLSQPKEQLSFGVGLSSSYDFCYPLIWNDVPYLPVSPTINVKLFSSEILIGADIYTGGPLFNHIDYAPFVPGGQFTYRYHLFKEHRRHNLFVNASIHGVRYQIGYGFSARNYHENPENYEDLAQKVISVQNSYGIGWEYKLLNKLYVNSMVACGYNYYWVSEACCPSGKKDEKQNFTGTILLGLIYRTH